MLRVVHFFDSCPVCFELFSKNKIFGNSKSGRARFFFRFLVCFEQIRVVLEMCLGTRSIVNFFVASLFPIYCITRIKFLAISKTDELDFFSDFSYF